MLKKIILWFLVLCCMCAIFKFSSQKAEESKKTSSKVIVTIIKMFDINDALTEDDVQLLREKLTFIVRKSAHFSIYAVLGILILLLLYEYGIVKKKALFISTVLSMLYACSDEIHQSFVSGRSGEIRDVLIDTCGALTGCIMVLFVKYIIIEIKTRRKTNGL